MLKMITRARTVIRFPHAENSASKTHQINVVFILIIFVLTIVGLTIFVLIIFVLIAGFAAISNGRVKKSTRNYSIRKLGGD